MENTQKAIEDMVKDGKAPPSLGRVSQQLNAAGKLARTSVSGPARAALPPAAPGSCACRRLPPPASHPRLPACPPPAQVGMMAKDQEGAPMSGDDAIEQTLAELNEATSGLPTNARQEIQAHLDSVQAAAQSLSRVSATLVRKSRQ